MNGPSKEEIKKAMEWDEISGCYYEEYERAGIMEAAYREAVKALQDAVARIHQYEMEVNYYDAPYYHKNAMKYYMDVIEKYPEEK